MRLRSLVLVFFTSAAAVAQTNEATALKLFREGQDAMKAQLYAEACPKFADSNKLDPQLGTLLNLAACHEKAGKVATAWLEYNMLVDLATKAGDTGRADYAQKHAAALEPLPALQLRVAAELGLKEVKIDEQAIGIAALGNTIPLDPGPHTLALSTDTQHWTQSIVVPTSGIATVEIALPAQAIETAPPVTETTKRSPLRPVGIVLAGIGVAGVAVGGIFGAIAIGDKSTVNQHCMSPPLCDADGLKAADAAHTNALVSTIGFIAGGVLLATGVTLFILGKPKVTTSARIVPTATGAMLVW